MWRFTDLVRGADVVREVKQKFPETEVVFRKFNLRPACDDCAITMAARKVGASLDDLLTEVNTVIYQLRNAATPEGGTGHSL